MEHADLNTPQYRTHFFQQTVLAKVAYWQRWLEVETVDIAALDRERDGILRGISFALDIGPLA